MAEAVAAKVDGFAGPAGVDLDVAALESYLRAEISGLAGPMEIEPAAGGMSNPTFFVSFGDQRLVLRKKPPVQLSAAAHRIDREYRLLRALDGSHVPVPAPILFCEDEAIVGTPFYVMARLEGTVSHEYRMPAFEKAVRERAYQSMAQTLAAIHQFDWARAGLTDFGRPGNYFERQIGGWSKQWGEFDIADNPDLDGLQAWLLENIPQDDGCATIAHGDFRVANVMFAFNGEVSGVFDWELATIGHPLADLGFCLQGWFLRPDENGGVLGLDLAPLGIPSARSFVEAYYDAAPSMPRLAAFHVAFAMYRAAVGVSGVAMRAEAKAGSGLAAGAEARRFAKAYARAGTDAIQNWDR